MKTASLLFVGLFLCACEPEKEMPAQHVVCADRFTGEHVFSFWEDTGTDATTCIGCSNFATFTLDDGRRAKISSADINENYACRVDATREPMKGLTP